MLSYQADMNSLSDEKTLLKVVFIFSLFTIIVISSTVGLALMGFGLLYMILIYGEKNSVFEFSKGRYDWGKTFGFGLILTFGFMVGSAGIFSVISQQPFDMFSTIKLLSSQSGVPITIDNPIVRLLIWGITIPVLESLFFLGVIGKQLANFLKVKGLDLKNGRAINTLIVILMVGASATVFHLAADVTTETALFVDFLFFSFSMAIVLKLDELKQATALHGIINIFKTAQELGLTKVFGI